MELRLLETLEDTGKADVVLFNGLEELVPRGVGGSALKSWLCAPIAGVPLFRRLFEPLVGTNVGSCLAEPSLVASVMEELTRLHPCFGHQLKIATEAQLKKREFREFPAMGLLDLCFPKSNPTKVFAVDSCPELLRVSKLALEGDLVGRPPNGEFEGDLLLGPKASVSRSVRVLGVAAVGSGSKICKDVVLGPSAVVGSGCTIGAEAVLADCIVLDGAVVPPGTKLIDTIWFP